MAVAALLILGVKNVDRVGHRAHVACARSPENDGWTDGVRSLGRRLNGKPTLDIGKQAACCPK